MSILSAIVSVNVIVYLPQYPWHLDILTLKAWYSTSKINVVYVIDANRKKIAQGYRGYWQLHASSDFFLTLFSEFYATSMLPWTMFMELTLFSWWQLGKIMNFSNWLHIYLHEYIYLVHQFFNVYNLEVLLCFKGFCKYSSKRTRKGFVNSE